jgi:hypothetical protein
MGMLSYNEEKNKKLKLRHIFFPSIYGFVSEVIIAILSLAVFNASKLSDQLLSKNFGTTDPLSLWSQLSRQLLDSAGQYHIVQQLFLFGLWAIVGALLYVLIFRILQVVFGVRHSVGLGMQFVREDPERGIFRWLASLHDFFFALLIATLGTAALASGTLVCFGIASQELSNGLAASFPGNLWPLLLSLLGAVLSVRLIAFGISLLSRRFRNWYTT